MHNELLSCVSKELKNKATYLEKILGVKEYAWEYSVAKEVIACLAENGFEILGVDILRKIEDSLEYDFPNNWYRNPDKTKTNTENISISCEKAISYIEDFHRRWGDDFLYVIIYNRL